MQVQILNGTACADRLVARCARGDYLDGYVGNMGYTEVMESVSFDEEHVQKVTRTEAVPAPFRELDSLEEIGGPNRRGYIETCARTYALLEDLFRKEHWGPFEHPQLTLAVEGVSVALER